MAPSELILVRHAESIGNVAREQAEDDRAEVIALEWRDADVPLSPQGRAQADALGSWLADRGTELDHVWSSPYQRARETIARALDVCRPGLPVPVDERLRDRELGILDRLTSWGVAARHPDEAARKRHLGKLYYRPPGGESWADIALRVRSFLRDLDTTADTEQPVLVCSHDAVIFLFRYVLEGLDEPALLDHVAHESIPNASVTRFVRTAQRWELAEFGAVEHLHDQGVAPTHHGATVDDHHPH